MAQDILELQFYSEFNQNLKQEPKLNFHTDYHYRSQTGEVKPNFHDSYLKEFVSIVSKIKDENTLPDFRIDNNEFNAHHQDIYYLLTQ